ncbi:MAG TPA: ankyrin repeat domain-containing protein [Candidatus Gracilibacteria bacterium]
MGKQNRDPLFWLFVMNRDTEAKKKGFKHLLKNGANPLHIAEDSQTVLHLSAGHKDPYYLKTILEVQPDIDIDFESSKSSWATPLMKALLSDRYENFKIILEHGTDIEKKNARGDTPLAMARSDYEFAYLLLQRGADYTVGEGEITGGNPKGRSALVWSIEALRYWPSMAIEHHGIDYREKVIEFLREKGVEVNPWYPEDHGFEP